MMPLASPVVDCIGPQHILGAKTELLDKKKTEDQIYNAVDTACVKVVCAGRIKTWRLRLAMPLLAVVPWTCIVAILISA